MKSSIIVGALGLAAVLAVGAQAAAKKPAAHPAAAATKSLTGCLEKGGMANTFKLTHLSDGGDWDLVGAPAALKMSDHVGHKVQVSGKEVAAAAGKTDHKLRVSAMTHVAATCP